MKKKRKNTKSKNPTIHEKMTKKILISVIILALIIFLLWNVSVLIVPPSEPSNVEKVKFDSRENFLFKIETWTYPMKGWVTTLENNNTTIPLGFAGQTYELNFGKIPIKSNSTKFINFNTMDVAKVEFYKYGNISPYVIIPKNFELKNQSKEVKIIFTGTEPGNYTGFLVIRTIVPKNRIIERVL
ncbi:MAG: hypothetical protein J7L45_01060 [Candidatus Aenigmarchaeota archaeon]|nr:hypothetical protein [Candidatus Aenigmarchaeota archaeon]